LLLLIAAGCARVPPPRTGVEAKARFLERYAGPPAPVRGAGTLTVRRDGSRRGAMQARWAAAGESVVFAGYVGPVRAVDAVLLGDSVFVALRPYDTGLTGEIRPGSPLDARAARFLTRPCQFGDPWIRGALERADVEPRDDGFRLRGTVDSPGAAVRVALDLNARGEPRVLTLSRAEGDEVIIRYGPPRGFAAGRLPGWIEWSFRTTVARLEIEELAPVDRSRIRLPSPAQKDWTMIALDDPRGEALLRRILGGREVRR
jgi:hypothetical protein